MKIFVNGTTAVAGGGVQRTASFIANSITEPFNHDFVYAISPMVMDQIKSLLDISTAKIFELTPSPVYLFAGRNSRKQLLEIERNYKPDLIFTTTSPSYTIFRDSLEAAVVSDPFFTHPNKMALSSYPRLDALKIKIKMLVCQYYFRKIKYFFVQTPTSAAGLAKRLHISPENIFLVSNCHNKIFSQNQFQPQRSASETPLIFVLTHPYYHKNLDIIPAVAALLKKRKIKLRFIMTLPEDHKITPQIYEKIQKLGVTEYIENVKGLTLAECRQWYEKCDAVFLPTLLETFSATYVEAMAMQRPLITTNFDFAKDICADAAEYFEPKNAEAATDAIINVINNQARYQQLVENGLRRLKQFPDPHQQYLLQIKALEECFKKFQSLTNRR